MPQQQRNDPPFWTNIKGAARHFGVSVRTICNWLSDPNDPLPCVRTSRRLTRIHIPTAEAWFIRRGETNGSNLDAIVDEVMEGL